MNIEIAPEKYCPDDITYNEAILYCFQLEIDGKIGWRLPTYVEGKEHNIFPCWFIDEYEPNGYVHLLTVPVRDI